MDNQKNVFQFFFEKLQKSKWPITADETNKVIITHTKENILSPSSNDNFVLSFISYSLQKNKFYIREKYKRIIFPKTFDISDFIYFKFNGNFKINYERNFKKIINPYNQDIETIQITLKQRIRRYYKKEKKLLLSLDFFKEAINDAKKIHDKQQSYANSIRNYLCNKYSIKYKNKPKKKITHIEKGEFKFLIDRFNLSTKKNVKDFKKYLNNEDLEVIENFFTTLIKKEVLSNEFLRRLDDYFIKEKLSEIISLGRKIINLKNPNMNSDEVLQIIKELNIIEEIKQLENLWQKYFEKYLLYLIFSYKKIFPKIELEGIDGHKKYPDFIGVNHYNGLDVIEIKTHLKHILVWDRNYQNFYFSPEISKAIVQVTNYLDAITQKRFKKIEDEDKITQFTDKENLYHPKGIIIISSTKKLTTKIGENEKLERDFTKLRNSLHNITILTFDDILNIANEYIKNIISK